MKQFRQFKRGAQFLISDDPLLLLVVRDSDVMTVTHNDAELGTITIHPQYPWFVAAIHDGVTKEFAFLGDAIDWFAEFARLTMTEGE